MSEDPREALLGRARGRGSIPQPMTPRDDDRAEVLRRARDVVSQGGRLDLTDERLHREIARLILGGS